MEATDRIVMRQERSKKRRTLWCGATVVLFVIAIIVGLAVGLTRRNKSHGGSSDLQAQILLPLYTSPDNGAWDPLFKQLEAQPKVNFTVIINPDNGPLNTSALSSTWKTNLERLNSFENARTIGYVNTNYSMRAIDGVIADSREYASWSYAAANGTYGVEGLYYDEVSANRSTEGAINYGMMIDWMVKVGTGFSPRQLVVHNTGVIPSYFDNTTDITVVFDGTYAQYEARKAQLEGLGKETRMSRGYFVNSLPAGKSKTELKNLIKEMSAYAGNLYVTDLSQDVSSELGATWDDFVKAVADLA